MVDEQEKLFTAKPDKIQGSSTTFHACPDIYGNKEEEKKPGISQVGRNHQNKSQCKWHLANGVCTNLVFFENVECPVEFSRLAAGVYEDPHDGWDGLDHVPLHVHVVVVEGRLQVRTRTPQQLVDVVVGNRTGNQRSA